SAAWGASSPRVKSRAACTNASCSSESSKSMVSPFFLIWMRCFFLPAIGLLSHCLIVDYLSPTHSFLSYMRHSDLILRLLPMEGSPAPAFHRVEIQFPVYFDAVVLLQWAVQRARLSVYSYTNGVDAVIAKLFKKIAELKRILNGAVRCKLKCMTPD